MPDLGIQPGQRPIRIDAPETDRQQISSDCETCHALLAEDEEDPQILTLLNPE